MNISNFTNQLKLNPIKLKTICLSLICCLFLIEANSQVTGKCFLDVNKNGLFDKNEVVFSNTQLRIYKLQEVKNYNMIYGKPHNELLVEVKTDAEGNYKIFPNFFPARLVIIMNDPSYIIVPPPSYTIGDIGQENNNPSIIIRKKGEVNLPLNKN